MSVQKLVGEFGAAAKPKLAAGGQPEDQLRGPLENLMHSLAELAGLPKGALVMTGEKSLADLRTRPDYGVEVQQALVGFIEVKAPGKGADPRNFTDGHDKAQWERLKSLPNLIYTDGNAVSLWRNGERVGDIVHFDGDVRSSGAKLSAPQKLLALVNDFLTWQPIAPKNPEQLAETAARLCRFLRDEVLEQLGNDNVALADLREDWRTLLFPDADDPTFADGYAQAVTFGLLMARSRDIALTPDLDDAARELSQSATLIGTALRLLTEQTLRNSPALKTLARVLDAVSWAQVSRGDPEAWINFYENFLSVYDNALRRKTGSYYTPPEVVQAMVRLTDEALKAPGRYGLARGLADTAVHIADPAVGSGTFPLAILRSIAATVEHFDTAGAVPGAITEAAKRLYGFELQFGPYAVAQLRLLAEMQTLGASGAPQLFVTDTLADPFADKETGQGIYKEISKSRLAAAKVKREAPITVVIGNPPYKDKANGKGAWIENGSGNEPGKLADWQPPAEWGVGAHAKHLRNLYVYFWRWAAWKVFEQGAGDAGERDGIVCYITVAGFLNGPGFQQMRADLRAKCDEIWVIDCSPEGHQPAVATRIFQGVQQPVCIVLASRSPDTDGKTPATVRYRALRAGPREGKFAELAKVTLEGAEWAECSPNWQAPFLPARGGSWADFWPLDSVIGDAGSGVMPGRTWVIAPDAESLKRRWERLVGEKDKAKRSDLFHPHEGGDRTLDKAEKRGLPGQHEELSSIEYGIEHRGSSDPAFASNAKAALRVRQGIRYGFRSFDRQWIIPDKRVINRPNPGLWEGFSKNQTILTALTRLSPQNGPAISFLGHIPDLDHFHGRGGRVFPLWQDADATRTNIAARAVKALSAAHGGAIDPVDVFAYVAGVLAHPAFTATHRDDLVRPGLRVPLTADRDLFDRAAKLGREVIWLHTFGERMADGKPAGEPRLPRDRAPTIPAAHPIPTDPENFPDTLDYDAGTHTLMVGTGRVENVPPEVWEYEVSGKNVLRQWFSYRRKDRSRPVIGDRRPPSELTKIQPDHWLPEYTSELINVLNVLAMLVDLEPKQAKLLEEIEDGPLIDPPRDTASQG
ncbi:N-6 DNA methylase [Erythrobacter sp. LQ02-29]|uniref:type ISP restriction/modification enzyme n=1 Tax=Erythrobacter sp. LQ02-29 TaxID=2920384 RepID=UPI001F4ECBED|nr:type ISP restriction/modification enzyme [Erythrobacter sp. LQ02-29]MCP9221490.1 N-6 DNA methylase [Erythrobacter sp. LQ02-29]